MNTDIALVEFNTEITLEPRNGGSGSFNPHGVRACSVVYNSL